MGGKSSLPPVKVFDKPIDLDKFLGKWYVNAVKPTYFEKRAYNPVETYSLLDRTKGTVDVKFTFNKDSVNGKQKKIPQKLYFDPDNGNWKVQPFSTFPLSLLKLDYKVLDIGGTFTEEDEGKEVERYEYIVVGYPSGRSYFWVMSRNATMSEELQQKCFETLTESGFDVSKAVFPEHSSS